MKSPLIVCVIFAALVTVPTLAAPAFEAVESESTIVLRYGDLEFLTYHKAEVPPPEGADPVFTRSGFIHPVKNPEGAILTGIHPDDHYHHLGLWHAWVKCQIDGKEVDFWNLKQGTGRVRYAKTLETVTAPDHAGFTVEQEHVAYLDGPEAEPTVILREAFQVTGRMVDEAFEIDYETRQKNVFDHALELPAYRYGGPIAYRAPAHWDLTNSDYLGSEGTTRIDGHETRSRWCAFWGPAESSEEAVASLAILGHRENHDFPQRMRVWPPNTHNGAIFFNYVPIQEHAWAIEPGDTSVMRYRLVAQNGKPEPETLNARWERFNSEKDYWTLASEVAATYEPKLKEHDPATMVKAAETFLQVLTEEERAQAQHALDSEERRLWTNVPPRGSEGGLRLGDLNREALERAFDLLGTVLSEQGYEKARNIMLADDELLRSQEQADRRGGFGSANFWLLIFGKPSVTEPWGLQLDGHHLAINLTMAGEKMTCSPAFIGTQPRAFELGGKEIVPMGKETALAFDFIQSLTEQQRADALKDERRGDLAAGAGRDGIRPDPRGLDCGSLTDAQREILVQLIGQWVRDMPKAVADTRMNEIVAQLDETRFAWRGPFQPGSDASYHLYGPAVIIEYAGQDLGGDPLDHLHSIYRDPTNEYGAKWIEK